MPRNIGQPGASTLFAMRVFVIADVGTWPTVILRRRFTGARETF